MNKPVNLQTDGLYKGKLYNPILPQAISKSQLSGIIELSKYVKICRIANALDLLEKRGFVGDLALLIIANFQNTGVAR